MTYVCIPRAWPLETSKLTKTWLISLPRSNICVPTMCILLLQRCIFMRHWVGNLFSSETYSALNPFYLVLLLRFSQQDSWQTKTWTPWADTLLQSTLDLINHYLFDLVQTYVSVSFPATIHFKAKSLCRKQCGRNAWPARKRQFATCCLQQSPITTERPWTRPIHWILRPSLGFYCTRMMSENQSFLFAKAWKVKDDLKKLIYSLIRAPQELVDLMKLSSDLYKWEHGGGDSCLRQTQLYLINLLCIQPCQPGWWRTWPMTSSYLGIACALKMWLIHGGGKSRPIVFLWIWFHCLVTMISRYLFQISRFWIKLTCCRQSPLMPQCCGPNELSQTFRRKHHRLHLWSKRRLQPKIGGTSLLSSIDVSFCWQEWLIWI